MFSVESLITNQEQIIHILEIELETIQIEKTKVGNQTLVALELAKTKSDLLETRGQGNM